MSWRDNRDLLFWYYVAWAVFLVFIAFLVHVAYYLLTTQQVRE